MSSEVFLPQEEKSINKLEPAQNYSDCQNDNCDFEGVIRLHKSCGSSTGGKIQELQSGCKRVTPFPGHKKKRRWLCQQFGLPSTCKRQHNFLNLTEEEIQQIRSHQEISAMRKEAQFRKMFSSYITGIIGDEGIMKEMNELVAKYDYRLAEKKLSMHRNWQKQVFEYTDEQVERKLRALTSDQIKDKLRHFHYQYMDASNRRLLFRDILDNSFYNPFESLKFSIKYQKSSCDPMKHDLDKETYEKLTKADTIAKCAVTRKILDVSKWSSRAFRSTIWGHMCADEEDGNHVPVKNLEKWYSHDVLHNTKFAGGNYWEQQFPRGKHIVPNQGKGWSFQPRSSGKAKVYGLEFMEQPKLQLYYT